MFLLRISRIEAKCRKEIKARHVIMDPERDSLESNACRHPEPVTNSIY